MESFKLPTFRKSQLVRVVVLDLIAKVERVSLEKGNYYYMVNGVPYAEFELEKV